MSPVMPSQEGVLPSQVEFYWKLQGRLGSGTYSVVRLATKRPLPKGFHEAMPRDRPPHAAVKVVSRERLTEEDLASLVEEVQILKLCNHPNVVNLVDFFVEVDHFYVVMELMRGGELFDQIAEHRHGYTERQARKWFQQIASSVAYLHSQNVAHRDIKPENILLSDDTDDATIKLADFGFARRGPRGRPMVLRDVCGTPSYVSPEVLKGGGHGVACDVWSLGVVLYILLCGYFPFSAKDERSLFRLIKRGKVVFDPAEWGAIGDDAKDLVRRCLTVDPKKRITAAGVLEHPWLVADDETVPDVRLEGTVEQLRMFNARRKLKGAMQAVRAIARTQALVRAIQDAAEAASESSSSDVSDGEGEAGEREAEAEGEGDDAAGGAGGAPSPSKSPTAAEAAEVVDVGDIEVTADAPEGTAPLAGVDKKEGVAPGDGGGEDGGAAEGVEVERASA